MMKKIYSKLLVLPILAFTLQVNAQVPVIVEAESGTLGSDYDQLDDGDVTYITPLTDFNNAAYPGIPEKVATYEITFPDTGVYKLYARVFIGSGGANDDSFFHGNGFGTKDETNDADWVTVNNITVAGFTIPGDAVYQQGDAPQEVWKWLALSDYTGQETPITFTVPEGALTQTFQIGAREDGLEIDKLAFAKAYLYYTVENLDNVESGSPYLPGNEPIWPPLAYGLDKFLGCVYGPASVRDFTGYWNQLTAENAGKWGSVEGTRDVMNWGGLDEAYQLAVDSGMPYRHHVMIWGNQQPGWMSDLSTAEQLEEIEEWMDTVAARYPDIWQVEVVNEPLHDPPDDPEDGGYIEALGGAGASGWDWIINSFRIARESFGDSVSLLLNDYNIMNSMSNATEYLEIVDLLVAEDTLLDAIGFQAHGFSHNTSNATITQIMDSLASRGLPLYITELDIDGNTDRQHVNGYMRLFPLFWEHPAVEGITLWGFRPGMWRTNEGAFLIDAENNERPAMTWLRAYLNGEFVPNEGVTVSTESGESTISTMAGTLQMVATFTPDTATLTTADWSVDNSDIATISEDGLLTAVANGTVTVTARSLEYQSDVEGTMVITITGQENQVESIAEAGVTLFPNPATDGMITLKGVENMLNMTILDLSGKPVANYDLHGSPQISVHLDVPAGMYIVRLTDATKTYFTKLVVK